MPETPAPKRPNLTERAVAHIRARIIDGGLRLGELVSESALAAELGMSKTPVREALVRLKQEGLVDILPQRGTVVFDMRVGEIEQISAFRAILEMAAVRDAMRNHWGQLVDRLERNVARMAQAIAEDNVSEYRRLDAGFHDAIIDLSDNIFLQEAYSRTAMRIQAMRTRLSGHTANNQRTLAEHQAIVSAIIRRDLAHVLEHLEEHIRKTQELYIRQARAGELIEGGSTDGAPG